MCFTKSLAILLVGLDCARALPVNGAARDSLTDWYADSASGVAKNLDERTKENDWYADSAKGIAGSLGRREAADTDWYADSAEGVSKSIQERETTETNWYADSAQGVSESIQERESTDTDWYADRAQGVSNSVHKRENAHTDWYADSASGIATEISGRADDTDWYADSASGISNSVTHPKESEDAASPEGIASSVEKRSMGYDEKESYELGLRRWIYDNMREDSLRETSERGKALFQFEIKLRNDEVDRWHVPADLQSRYDHSKSDAERVSVLNYYLMVTGREPKSALELGFTPTASEPGLVEENEVGYGYALAGQHQYHCVDFVADAIDIGKANINDFYLKHTIHCLGLLKYLAPGLTTKQPLAFLRQPANDRIQAGYRQTIH